MFRPAPSKPIYTPTVRTLAGGGYEQVFAAGYVSFTAQHGVLTIGLTENEREAVHGLVISIPEDDPFSPSDVYIEFNEQGSGCTGTDVTLSLVSDQFVVEYSDDADVFAGRISYSAEADPFREPEESYEYPLRRLVVELKVPSENAQQITQQLKRLQRNGVRIGRLSNSA